LALKVVSLVALGIGIAVAITFVTGLDGSSPRQISGSSSGRMLGGIRLTPCEEQQPGVIALLGRLAPGHPVAELKAKGYGAVAAVEGAESGLVVIFPGDLEPDINRLKKESALSVVGPLLAQTNSDPDLRSCDYRLSDKPKAAAFAEAASEALVDAGLLTRAQIDEGGTIFMLSDDPTNPDHLFLTVSTAVGLETLPTSMLDLSGLRSAYVAVIDKATGTILDTGKAHWYDGQ
jgi:hypothetical protein